MLYLCVYFQLDLEGTIGPPVKLAPQEPTNLQSPLSTFYGTEKLEHVEYNS
jgi:hypothetical protein